MPQNACHTLPPLALHIPSPNECEARVPLGIQIRTWGEKRVWAGEVCRIGERKYDLLGARLTFFSLKTKNAHDAMQKTIIIIRFVSFPDCLRLVGGNADHHHQHHSQQQRGLAPSSPVKGYGGGNRERMERRRRPNSVTTAVDFEQEGEYRLKLIDHLPLTIGNSLVFPL